MGDDLEELGSDLGVEVPVREVGAGLRKLWAEDDHRTRASLANLAIYSERLGSLGDNSRLLGELTKDHACRALLVLRLPGEDPEHRAWITAHCHLGNGRTVCSEQVSFLLRGGDPATVRNIVFSNLDSDLPLVFWWQGDFSAQFEDRLYSVIDHLVVDSSSWSDPARGLGVLAAAQAEASSRFVASDFAWTRSHSLRAALASRFEVTAARSALPELEKLEIRLAPDRDVEAAFLVAWVAYSLDASPSALSRGAMKLRRRSGADLEVGIEEAGDGHGPRIALSGPGTSFSAEEKDGQLVAEFATPGCSDRQVLPLGPTTAAGLLQSILQRSGDRSLYGRLIPMVRELL